MITVVHVNIVTAYNTSNSSLCATPARVVLIVISKAMPARMPAAPYPPLSPAGLWSHYSLNKFTVAPADQNPW